jgi:WD40 repeat protein
MKISPIRTSVAPFVLSLSCLSAASMAGDAEPLNLIRICPWPGCVGGFTYTIGKLSVYSRGDTDIISSRPHFNGNICYSFDPKVRVLPTETIVLEKWDRKKAELSLLRCFDDMPIGICVPIAEDGESCVLGVSGIVEEPPPARFASAYAMNGSGKLVRLKAPEDVESEIAISPDGRLIAWGCRGGKVRVRSVSSDQDLLDLVSDTGEVAGLTLPNDGRMLALDTSRRRGFERTLLLDLQGNRVLGTLTNPRRAPFQAWPSRCFSARGNAYGVSTAEGHVVVCNLEKGTAIKISKLNKYSQGVFALSSDARFVIAGGWAGDSPHVVGEIKVWDCLTSKVVKSAHEPRLGEIKSLALSSDDRFLFVGDDKGRIGIFDLDPNNPGTDPPGPAG